MTEEAKWCVEALRDNINNGFLLVGGFNGSVHASEIIHLIESLSTQLEQVENERDGLNIMLAQAQAMLETRTKQRDAAIADLKLVVSGGERMRKQMVCPKCKHEFTYDNGDIDMRIAHLKKDIAVINTQIQEYNALSTSEQRSRYEWRRYAAKALTKKTAELRDLKEYRKLADQQIKNMEFHLFKALTREYVGEDVYMEIIEKMEADLEAYKVSGCMQHEYTRSHHMSSATSINKL